MEELDEYGNFNTRYEGAGALHYVGADPVDVYFEARQLFDGQLLIACVAPNGPILPGAVALNGHLLSGESFSTMWGRGIREVFRREDRIHKVHYVATMMRVRYTQDAEPVDHAVQFALHNFVPGRSTDISNNKIEIRLQDCALTIIPAGNYKTQADRLLRYGGNLRTSWAKVEHTPVNGTHQPGRWATAQLVDKSLIPLSLALGTSVTSPQMISFDAKGNRNDVEHYTSSAAPFSDFIGLQGWDTSVSETTVAWFSMDSTSLIDPDDLAVSVHHHLDACAKSVYLETRALVSATLLDVLAGRYTSRWAPHKKPHEIAFKIKLRRLLNDLDIPIKANSLDAVIRARNSLVHAGKFGASGDQTYLQYKGLLLLGRSVLLHLMGFKNKLHEEIAL